MSKEGYITKGNLKDYTNQTQELPGNEQLQDKQHTEEWQAYQKLQTDSNKLITNKRTNSSGKTKDDSELMRNVKKSLNNITEFYIKTALPANKKDFDKQLQTLQEMYIQLKNSCQTYLDQRKSIWKNIIKGEGYRRYQMVKEAQTKATVELAFLKHRAQLLYDNFQDVTEETDRPLWVNVLAEARTTYLDLTQKDVGTIDITGGNCNSVIKLTYHNKDVAYIKEDIKNIPAIKYTDSYIVTFLQSNLAQEARNAGITDQEMTDMIKALSSVFAEENTAIDQIFWKDAGENHYSAASMRLDDVQRELAHMIIEQRPSIKNQLNSFLDKPCGYVILGDYAEFYSKHIRSYLIARDSVKMDKGSSITDRNVATSRLAELLGVPELVSASRKVTYKYQGEKNCQGIIMAEANGEELCATYKKAGENYKYDDQIFLQLNTLEVLDVIAGQFDRGNTNIFVENEGENYTKIKAIDNDLSFGKLSYKDIKKRNRKGAFLTNLEDQNGFCKLKAIDKRLYDSLMVLTDEMVNYVFADLLTKDELKALRDRIKGVKKLLQHTVEKDKNNFYLCNPNDNISSAINHVKKSQVDKNCYLKTHHLLAWAQSSKNKKA